VWKEDRASRGKQVPGYVDIVISDLEVESQRV
jgi:hypothetical protein